MRKLLWIMLAVMVVAVSAPNAHGDGFTPTITCTGLPVAACTPPPFAIFTPGAPVGTVEIGLPSVGISISMDLNSGGAPTDTFDWALGTGSAGGVNEFILDVNTGQGIGVPFTCASISSVPGLHCGDGTLTFTPVAAPEPSSVALMLLGVGILFVMRKRVGYSRPSAV